MGDPKKGKKGGSKAGPLLLIVLLGVIGAGALGWFYPDTPVVGDLVHGFFEKGAKGVDKSGVYKVTVAKLVLDPQEFKNGENVDIQIVVKKVDRDGKETTVWDSEKLGDNLREVGKQELGFNLLETPFELTWEAGDQITVEVWDRKGLSDRRHAWFKSLAGGKEFPLSETQTLTLLEEGDVTKNPRVGGTNQITFDAKRIGDIPVEGAPEE